MMYRYSAYILRHLIHATLLVAFSLTSIVWLTQALRFIDFIVNQGVSVGIFVKLTALLVPSLLLLILPPALLVAVLFVYNRMKADNELVVLQAAGLSHWRLARPALLVAAGVTLFGYLVAFWLQPASFRQFKEMQIFLRNSYVSILLQDGVFSTPVEGLMVFIRERDSDNILHGILVHDSRQSGESVTMMAEEGRLVQTAQGPRFLLKRGNRQEMKNGRLSLLNFESYTLDISFYAPSMGARPPEPQEMGVSQLFAQDDSVSFAENYKRRAEGHQRLLWPAYSLTLTLLTLAVLLSGEFNRRGHWRRIAVAAALSAAVLFGAVGLRGMMAINPAIIPLAYLNLLLPAVIACRALTVRIPGIQAGKAAA